jgi:hypothetical protein
MRWCSSLQAAVSRRMVRLNLLSTPSTAHSRQLLATQQQQPAPYEHVLWLIARAYIDMQNWTVCSIFTLQKLLELAFLVSFWLLLC